MNELRLRFSDGDQPDLVLGAGVHALGRRPDGLGPVDAEQPWLLQLCNDRRGIWLTVADDLRGVHVNGRPVQTLSTFVGELERAGIDATVELTVRRGEKERRVRVKVIDLRG